MALSDDDDLLAAEIAFDLIDGEERRAAEARLATDMAFAQALARWQDHAAAMFDGSGEAPRPSLWRAIETKLPANDVALVPAARSLRRWQMATLVASAAAILLGVVAMQTPKTMIVPVPVARAPLAPMVAVLSGAPGVVTISFDPGSGRMISATSGLAIGHHTPELWVIPADGKPRSLGMLAVSAPGWAKVSAAAAGALGPGVTIAVSVEPIGGSPTGQPTGPVILTGTLRTV